MRNFFLVVIFVIVILSEAKDLLLTAN